MVSAATIRFFVFSGRMRASLSSNAFRHARKARHDGPRFEPPSRGAIIAACASTAVIYLVQYAAGYPLVSHGTDAQKRRYLPRLAAGEITCALSISEPGAGSDAASMTTTAVRRGDRYVLNGTKMWVTNGSH